MVATRSGGEAPQEDQAPVKKRRSAWDDQPEAAAAGPDPSGPSPLAGFVPSSQNPAGAGGAAAQGAGDAFSGAFKVTPDMEAYAGGPPSQTGGAYQPGQVVDPVQVGGGGSLVDMANRGGGMAPIEENIQTVTVNVPLTAAGLLIGPGGATIKKLQVQAGAMIQVDKAQDERNNFKTVTVMGPPAEVAAAKQLIQDLIERSNMYQAKAAGTWAPGEDSRTQVGDWQCPSCMGNNFASRTDCFKCGTPSGRTAPAGRFPITAGEVEIIVHVPNGHVGLIIGKGGETIQMLTAKTGARIQIKKDAECSPMDTERPVTVQGIQANVDEGEFTSDTRHNLTVMDVE